MEVMEHNHADGQTVSALIPDLLAGMNIPSERQAMYSQRLNWGLENYFAHHYSPSANEEEE
jgi:hypothetical protein